MSGPPVAIDGLPAAVLPLAGTEPVAIVQSGVTRQAPASAISSSTGTLAYSIESVSFSATAGVRYALLTGTGAITVTLPQAAIGNGIELADMNHKADVNHITLSAHSGDSIIYQASSAGTQAITTPGAVVRLVCYAANTWRALLIGTA